MLILEHMRGLAHLPLLVKVGLVAMAFAGLLDVVVHLEASGDGHLHAHTASEASAHLAGLVSMVVIFLGVVIDGVRLAIHLLAFLVGAYFAWRSFGAGATTLGAAFSLFALAEISYMTYHLDWTNFLFAHLISEVLDLLAFVLVFVAATQRALIGSAAPSR
jgi:hypothetical protein